MATPRKTASKQGSNGILERLGLFGLGKIEPVILAALASELPLLLIGPHGCAKSMLLERLAKALALEFRHYNASLLNYDDLVGYPLPDEHGSLRYVQTPASIWPAEAVFLDELSRCRPDMQNRLFSIIHEKRVQGIALERLRYRWSAMNPPPCNSAENDAPESADDSVGYAGSEPLDAALADRFGFIVEMPSWKALSVTARNAIISHSDCMVAPAMAQQLHVAINDARAVSAQLEKAFAKQLTEYTRRVVDHSYTIGIELSARRANLLMRVICSVHAVRYTNDPLADLGESCWMALSHSLPQRAQGIRIPDGKLLAAHRDAWKIAQLSEADPRRMLAAESDHVRRALLALLLTQSTDAEASAHVADALAHCKSGAREAFALHLIEHAAIGRVHVAVAEQIAELTATTQREQTFNTSIAAGSTRHAVGMHVECFLASLVQSDEHGLLRNLVISLYARDEKQTIKSIDRAIASWVEMRARFRIEKETARAA